MRGLAFSGVEPVAGVTILRGELRSVMSAAHLGWDRRLLLQKNARFVESRPLAVASAQMSADGSRVWEWVSLGAVRLYLLFYSRDRFVRWSALWPLKSVQDARNLGRTLSAYLLIRHEAPLYVAHNPLQQFAYSGIYIMAVLQGLTGFALYGLYNVHSGFWALFQSPVDWWGAPTVRVIHYLIMLVFWAFLLLHVYLVVRADTIERHGGLSSMISGGVWLHRGSHPVDDPTL